MYIITIHNFLNNPEGYNVDPKSVTVSGLSAGRAVFLNHFYVNIILKLLCMYVYENFIPGGALATQFHFAFSSEIAGAGVYAGRK